TLQPPLPRGRGAQPVSLPNPTNRSPPTLDASQFAPPASGMDAGVASARHDASMAVRILTVEDDERIQAAMRLALEDEGYTVVEAATGEEGLELFGRRPADVVLID